MASRPGSAAPSLFLRNATGLVKGWSGFDAFAYSFMSVNLVTLGMFYSLAIFAYVPDGSAVASIIVTAIGMTFMVIAYAGLIAVMPRAGGDYVWQTRVLDGIPGAVAGGVFGGDRGFLVGTALALGDRSTYGGAIVGASSGRRSPEARWRRVRPVGDGLVVHPRALGADLRIHPQDRVRQPLAALWAGTGRRVLRHGGRDVRGVDRHDHHHVGAGCPGDGGLCQDPALVPVHRSRRRCLMFVLMLDHDGGHVQARLRQGGRGHVRRPQRLPGDDRPGRADRRPPTPVPSSIRCRSGPAP